MGHVATAEHGVSFARAWERMLLAGPLAPSGKKHFKSRDGHDAVADVARPLLLSWTVPLPAVRQKANSGRPSLHYAVGKRVLWHLEELRQLSVASSRLRSTDATDPLLHRPDPYQLI
jgi:hypothetical protein